MEKSIEISYISNTISYLKKLSIKKKLKIDDNYWDWFKKTNSFKDMIEIEMMNNKTPKQASNSIISIWR